MDQVKNYRNFLQWLASLTCFLLFVAIKCHPLRVPGNGKVFGKGMSFNSSVILTCNKGFTLNGNAIRTCQANRSWSGKPATCEGKCSAKLDCFTLTVHTPHSQTSSRKLACVSSKTSHSSKLDFPNRY